MIFVLFIWFDVLDLHYHRFWSGALTRRKLFDERYSSMTNTRLMDGILMVWLCIIPYSIYFMSVLCQVMLDVCGLLLEFTTEHGEGGLFLEQYDT